MIPDFYVFNTPYAAEIIKNIESIGFNAFVSSKSDHSWLAERFINKNRYLVFWDPDRYGHLEEEYLDDPLLVISLPEDCKDWGLVARWIQAEIFNLMEETSALELLGFEKPETQKRDYTPPGEEVILDGLKSHVLSIPPAEIDLKDGYSFQCFYDEFYDVKYYEVIA